MAGGVDDRDTGYRDLMRVLEAMGCPVVLVGIREAKGSVVTEGGDTVAGYATKNEFGSEDGRVPERSFLRSTVDGNEARYTSELEAAVGKVVDGSANIGQAFGLVGAKVARDVQQTIRDMTSPPNAPRTIAMKGSSHPLIDTGRMLQSIDYEVRAHGAVVEQGVGE